jgi:ABC-type transport system involved in multi-copper enzyme maturation permease subunit
MLSSALAIAKNTFIGFMRDRIFYVILLFDSATVAFSIVIADLSIVETQKVILDFGLATVSIYGILISLLVGLLTISKELENKTVYMILAKPVSREAFVLGKFLGCAALSILVHVVLSVNLYLILLGFGAEQIAGIFPCFVLMILESILILSVAVFFSTTTSSSFLAGSLTIGVLLVGKSDQSLRLIIERTGAAHSKIILRTFYDIFPSLSRFNIRDLVAYSKPYPREMLATSSVYFFAYVSFFLCMTIFIFRKKDLS